MNTIEKQKTLINELYRFITESFDVEFDTACCKFVYYVAPEDRSSFVQYNFYYVKGGKKTSEFFPENEIVVPAVRELHKLMTDHTGGDWESFELHINSDGSVTTKFGYK